MAATKRKGAQLDREIASALEGKKKLWLDVVDGHAIFTASARVVA